MCHQTLKIKKYNTIHMEEFIFSFKILKNTIKIK
jgi:hypothetical protein